jgi:hypothetical protein
MSLLPSAAPPSSDGDALKTDDGSLEQEEKEDCDHLCAALVTGQIAALRLLHIPLRSAHRAGVKGRSLQQFWGLFTRFNLLLL